MRSGRTVLRCREHRCTKWQVDSNANLHPSRAQQKEYRRCTTALTACMCHPDSSFATHVVRCCSHLWATCRWRSGYTNLTVPSVTSKRAKPANPVACVVLLQSGKVQNCGEALSIDYLNFPAGYCPAAARAKVQTLVIVANTWSYWRINNLLCMYASAEALQGWGFSCTCPRL